MTKKLFGYSAGLFVLTIIFTGVVSAAKDPFVEFIFGAFGVVSAVSTVVCCIAAVVSHID